MFRKIYFITVLLLVLIFPGCTSSPITGLFVTNTKHHISGYMSSYGNSIGDGKIEKMGSSCVWGIFPFTYVFYRPKDTNVAEAMEKGGITKIGVVDRRSLSILSMFYRECVEVWGE